MSQRGLQLLFGVGYVVIGAIGVALLQFRPSGPEAGTGRWFVLFPGMLLVLVAAGGLVLVAFVVLFARFRPGPVVGTAPSGAPATFFRRSAFLPVMSVVMTVALASLLGAVAVVAHAHAHDVAAVLLVFGAVALLAFVVVPVVAGRIAIGGLWLTPAGVEYRRDAAGWALSWSELQHVEHRPQQWTVVGALPSTGGRVVPVEPVVLRLALGVRVPVHRTVRGMWNRECRMPQDMVCIDCFDLAGGAPMIAEAIDHYLLFPELRDHLGTAASMPHRPL
jgi:hypothetical protein